MLRRAVETKLDRRVSGVCHRVFGSFHLLVEAIKILGPYHVMATFLYRRASDNMLVLHATTDYEFNDRNIQKIMESARIPRHLGNFVRDHVEKYATIEHMRIINDGDFTETNRLIRDALRAYAFLDSHERIKLHKKELNRIRSELRREQAWSVY